MTDFVLIKFEAGNKYLKCILHRTPRPNLIRSHCNKERRDHCMNASTSYFFFFTTMSPIIKKVKTLELIHDLVLE